MTLLQTRTQNLATDLSLIKTRLEIEFQVFEPLYEQIPEDITFEQMFFSILDPFNFVLKEKMINFRYIIRPMPEKFMEADWNLVRNVFSV
jgi:hypothetical protein